jgi:hypothetical protein
MIKTTHVLLELTYPGSVDTKTLDNPEIEALFLSESQGNAGV